MTIPAPTDLCQRCGHLYSDHVLLGVQLCYQCSGCTGWVRATVERGETSASPAAPPAGAKHDAQKPRWSLLPLKALARVVDVLEYGARKYAPGNWMKVENAHQRYFDAALRHLTAWYGGENDDPESGLPHLAHAACCVLFLLGFSTDVPWLHPHPKEKK